MLPHGLLVHTSLLIAPLAIGLRNLVVGPDPWMALGAFVLLSGNWSPRASSPGVRMGVVLDGASLKPVSAAASLMLSRSGVLLASLSCFSLSLGGWAGKQGRVGVEGRGVN